MMKYIIGFSTEITSLKQAEVRLRQTLKYEQTVSKLAAQALQEGDLEVFLLRVSRY
ncbi:hypothetical protein SDD30_02240 [Moorella naiadis]|uniref:hypothetical protein n=1 Tax=Moorella naiadis (nom. illeg.) TaxID=3093670 RepID=UPI003D9CB2A4